MKYKHYEISIHFIVKIIKIGHAKKAKKSIQISLRMSLRKKILIKFVFLLLKNAFLKSAMMKKQTKNLDFAVFCVIKCLNKTIF